MYGINDLKNGTTFELDGQPFIVLDYQHSKQGRSGAVLRTKIKNLLTGATIQRTFSGNEKFNEIQIDRKKVQYLYTDGGHYYFMDQDDYSQFDLPAEELENSVHYLKDGEVVQFQFYGDKPINLDLPVKMDFLVTEAGEGLKGDTASGSTKVVTIETGLKVNVPLFIKEGEVIRVNTTDGSYVERAK
jgi:elongation factor P